MQSTQPLQIVSASPLNVRQQPLTNNQANEIQLTCPLCLFVWLEYLAAPCLCTRVAYPRVRIKRSCVCSTWWSKEPHLTPLPSLILYRVLRVAFALCVLVNPNADRGRRRESRKHPMCETPISFYAHAHTWQTDRPTTPLQFNEINNTYTLLKQTDTRPVKLLLSPFTHVFLEKPVAKGRAPPSPLVHRCVLLWSCVTAAEREPKKLPLEIRFLRRPDSRAPLLVCPPSTLGFS